MKSKARIGILDCFRGIAALSVVFFHYTHIFRARYGHNFSAKYDFDLGFNGVYLFFIISGFVIFMTAEKCYNGVDFLYRRFVRLYPTYWVCLIFSLVYLSFIAFNKSTHHFNLKQILINFTMLQKVFNAKAIDGAYWSLFPELLFYGIIFCTILVNKLRSIYLWGTVWIALSLINGIFHLHLLDFLFQYAGLFCSGILFYRLSKGDGNPVITNMAILVCYLTVLINFSNKIDISLFNLPITAIYMLFYAFVYKKILFLDNMVMRFFGNISYPLYLIHQEFGYSIMLKLKSIGLDHYWVIFIPMALATFIAYLITTFIEKPLLKFAKQVIEPKILSVFHKNAAVAVDKHNQV